MYVFAHIHIVVVMICCPVIAIQVIIVYVVLKLFVPLFVVVILVGIGRPREGKMLYQVYVAPEEPHSSHESVSSPCQ